MRVRGRLSAPADREVLPVPRPGTGLKPGPCAALGPEQDIHAERKIHAGSVRRGGSHCRRGGRVACRCQILRCAVRPAAPTAMSTTLSSELATGPRGHPRALPCRPGSHRDACCSGDRPRPGRPCSRRLSPSGRRDARDVACIPGDRQGRRLAGFPAGGTLASGTGDQLFRDEWGRGAGDLARDGC